MGIQINGVEMPKNCKECIYSGMSPISQIYTCDTGWGTAAVPILFAGQQVERSDILEKGRADNCPLSEAPVTQEEIERLINDYGLCASCKHKFVPFLSYRKGTKKSIPCSFTPRYVKIDEHGRVIKCLDYAEEEGK